MARRQIEISNQVAAELAGAQDRMLRELEERVPAGPTPKVIVEVRIAST